MPMSTNVKNALTATGLLGFAGAVFAHTVNRMKQQDDFADLDGVTVINAHQSGNLSATDMTDVVERLKSSSEAAEFEKKQA